MPHTPHPAIQRGRYEVETFGAGRIGTSGQRCAIQPVAVVLRVVDFDTDLDGYLSALVPEGHENPDGLDADEIVQLVAPFLRGGLLDPGSGQGPRWRPPVRMELKESHLRFVQVVGCLN